MFRFPLCDPLDELDVSFYGPLDMLDALTKVPFCAPLDMFDALTNVPLFFRVSPVKAALVAFTLWPTIIRVCI